MPVKSDHSARIVLIIVAIVTIVRAMVAARAGLGDVEAYYWTWSRHLAPGYLDHGSAVAFLIWIGTAILGDTTLGVRLPFILLSAATLLLLARLAAQGSVRGWRAGIWCVVCLLAMPVFQIAGAAANPDVPLIFLVSLFMSISLPRGRSPGFVTIVTAGFIAGLACNAKLFALALAPAMVSMAWTSGRRWRSLIAGAGAMIVGCLPVLLWNYSSGWASLSYHLVDRHTRPAGPSLLNLAQLVGGQLAYISPVVLFGLLAAGLVVWRRRTETASARLMFWIAAPLVAAGYLLILLVPSAEPHWPVAGYLPLAIVLAGELSRGWYGERPRVRLFVRAGLVFSCLVAIGIHVHVLTDLGIRLMPADYNHRYDLSNELRGWPRVADAVAASLAEHPADRVAGCHYTSCAQLAFAAAGRFTVHCPSPRIDQNDFFPGGDGSTLRGVDLLYVKDERFPFDADLLYRCATVKRWKTVQIIRAGRRVRRFDLQRCLRFEGLKSPVWPPERKR